ncbi:unnamed protein product [Trichobilharzia regenti]|nr:unnamed protein product [Trichobilharzia regenti]
MIVFDFVVLIKRQMKIPQNSHIKQIMAGCMSV